MLDSRDGYGHRERASAVFEIPCVYIIYHNVHIGELDGDIREHTDPVEAGYHERCAEILFYGAVPICVYPSVFVAAMFKILRDIAAVARMDRHAMAAGNKADD